MKKVLRSFSQFLFLFFVLGFFLNTNSASALEKGIDQGLLEISRQITESIPSNSKTTIAVMDFNDLQGNVTLLGRYIGEELITRLFQSKQVEVIERSLLDKAIQELKFNTSDLVDASNAKQLGRVVGADAIVVGTLTDLGQSLKINARVIMVESGKVIGAASVQIVQDTNMERMQKKVLAGVLGQSRIVTTRPEEEIRESILLKKVEVKKFTIELKECKLSGDSIACDLVIINNGADDKLELLREGTRIFDESGAEYSVNNFQLGNRSSSNHRHGGTIWGISNSLISGIPAIIRLEFKDVPKQISKITLLEMQFASKEDKKFSAQIRDISVIH